MWAALEAVVPDVPMPKRSVVEPMIGWSQPGARAWATARARGLRVPALPQYGIPDPLVGHAFAELPDPFVAAAEMESLPYDFFGLAPSSLDLWAWHRAPS